MQNSLCNSEICMLALFFFILFLCSWAVSMVSQKQMVVVVCFLQRKPGIVAKRGVFPKA